MGFSYTISVSVCSHLVYINVDFMSCEENITACFSARCCGKEELCSWDTTRWLSEEAGYFILWGMSLQLHVKATNSSLPCPHALVTVWNHIISLGTISSAGNGCEDSINFLFFCVQFHRLKFAVHQRPSSRNSCLCCQDPFKEGFQLPYHISTFPPCLHF